MFRGQTLVKNGVYSQDTKCQRAMFTFSSRSKWRAPPRLELFALPLFERFVWDELTNVGGGPGVVNWVPINSLALDAEVTEALTFEEMCVNMWLRAHWTVVMPENISTMLFIKWIWPEIRQEYKSQLAVLFHLFWLQLIHICSLCRLGFIGLTG